MSRPGAMRPGSLSLCQRNMSPTMARSRYPRSRGVFRHWAQRPLAMRETIGFGQKVGLMRPRRTRLQIAPTELRAAQTER